MRAIFWYRFGGCPCVYCCDCCSRLIAVCSWSFFAGPSCYYCEGRKWLIRFCVVGGVD